MHSRKLNRTEFANLMMEWKPGQKFTPNLSLSRPASPPSDDDLWVCWRDDEMFRDELPLLVVVADHGLEDFFAWTITFLPAYRPLTSFLRVLPWTIFDTVYNKKESCRVENRAVLVGLVLAETLTNAVGRGFIDGLPMTAYETTYSYAASRAITLGYDEATLGYIFRGWQSVREISDQRGRRLPPDLLLGVWNVIRLITKNKIQREALLGGSGMTTDILSACAELSEQGHLHIQTVERLSHGRISPHLFFEATKMPKEHRVIAFESTLRQIAVGPTGEPSINFVVGYLASLVSDGSLEHAHLIFPFQAQFPTAMLWYGVCASLAPATRVLTDYGHLGVRILRMIERREELLAAPTCDISLAELEIMLRGQPRSRTFRQINASSLRVELAPAITTVIRSVGHQPLPEQPGLFGEEMRQPVVEVERLRDLVSTLKNSLTNAEAILSNTINPNADNEHQHRAKRKRQ